MTTQLPNLNKMNYFLGTVSTAGVLWKETTRKKSLKIQHPCIRLKLAEGGKEVWLLSGGKI